MLDHGENGMDGACRVDHGGQIEAPDLVFADIAGRPALDLAPEEPDLVLMGPHDLVDKRLADGHAAFDGKPPIELLGDPPAAPVGIPCFEPDDRRHDPDRLALEQDGPAAVGVFAARHKTAADMAGVAQAEPPAQQYDADEVADQGQQREHRARPRPL